jgi:hypothetical protein
MSSENHYVTPTYQAFLILSLDTVAKRLMDRDFVGGWQTLQTLYVELPPECQKEYKNDFENVQKNLAKIANVKSFNYYNAYHQVNLNTHSYLAKENLQLFDKFKNSLFSKGYLETSPTKPRNLQPTTLGE